MAGVLLSTVGMQLEETEIGVWAHPFKEKSPRVSRMLWPPLSFVALSLLFSEMSLRVCVDVSVAEAPCFLFYMGLKQPIN